MPFHTVSSHIHRSTDGQRLPGSLWVVWVSAHRRQPVCTQRRWPTCLGGELPNVAFTTERMPLAQQSESCLAGSGSVEDEGASYAPAQADTLARRLPLRAKPHGASRRPSKRKQSKHTSAITGSPRQLGFHRNSNTRTIMMTPCHH